MIRYQDYENDILTNLSRFIQIPTLYDAATVRDGMPYGKKVYEGYEWIRDLALSDGFRVIEFDGHCLAIELPGNHQGKNRIDIVSHIDVVDPGVGWEGDPFSGDITAEAVWGRGSLDMKSTLILTYYGLKYIKDHNIFCEHNIRLVFGCDEERTMEDMYYYKERAGEPDFAFTPDGRFPYCYGEKGAIMWRVTGDEKTTIEKLEGGVQCNVISPIAKARWKDLKNSSIFYDLMAEKGYEGEVAESEEGFEITIYGKGAHASLPELGENATIKLLDIIQTATRDSVAHRLYQCFHDPYGTAAGIDVNIPPMGTITLNLGILRMEAGEIYAEVDCRYPKGVTSEQLTKELSNALAPLKMELCYDDQPSLIDDNQPYCKVLLEVYQEVTGDYDSKPFITGAVTYSKVFQNCVSFGPLGQKDISLAHQVNEQISRKELEKLFYIYTESMVRLAQL